MYCNLGGRSFIWIRHYYASKIISKYPQTHTSLPFIILYAHLGTCVCVCGGMYTHTCVCVYGGEYLILGIFLNDY